MIGLLGGIGPFSTARYYEDVVRVHHDRTRTYPELAIFNLDFDRFTEFENRPDGSACVAYMLEGIDRLARAGASVVAVTANSAHAHLDAVVREAPVPIVSIVEPVVAEATRRGHERVLLLGIAATARAGFYQTRLRTVGVATVLPAADEQRRIDAIVFGQLGRGVVTEGARDEIRAVVRRHPADAVVLGCTELPLLVGSAELGVDVIDTLALHVAAIVDHVVARQRSRNH